MACIYLVLMLKIFFVNTVRAPKKKVLFLARIYRGFVRSLGFSAARDIPIWMNLLVQS